MRRQTLKAGKDEIVHFDRQQCLDQEAPHIHKVCHCDPDAQFVVEPDDEHPQTWNVRAHIKQYLDGHWPLAAGQDVVIDHEGCGGAVKRVSTHKAALSYEPLGAKR